MDQVDTIATELTLRYAQYVSGVDTVVSTNKRLNKSIADLAKLGAEAPPQYADNLGKAASQGADAHEKAAIRIKAARKTTTDAAKADTDAVKSAEREKQAAIVASTKAIEQAAAAEAKFQAQQSKRAQTRYYAQGPAVFEAKAQEFSAADRLRDAEAAKAEAAAIREIALAQNEAAAAEARYYAQGPKVFEAKARQFSAEDRKAQTAATREAAAAEAELAKAREADSAAAERLAEREVRLNANSASRVIHDRTVTPGSGAMLGATVPGRADNARQGLMTGVSSGAVATADVETEREVNALAVEIYDAKQRTLALEGAQRAEAERYVEVLQRQAFYQRQGYADIEASIRAEERQLLLEKDRAATAEKQAVAQAANSRSGTRQFLEGATLGYGPALPTAAGIAVAAGAAVGVAAVTSATEYARALSDVSKAAGISAEALQVYQHAAVNAGAKSTDFDTAISQLSENLGKARTGADTQGKAFAALGINIKNASTAGDLMPTLIERISSISDQSKRAAVETALFGESGRKLDGLLSGGNQRVSELAAGLERTGAVLSSSDIAKLNDTADKLASVKAQLEVDVAQVVAGNADAILKLAAAFATLVDDVKDAVSALERFNQQQGHSGLINTDFLAKPEPAKAQSFGDYLYSQVSRASGAATGFLRGRIAGNLPAAQSNSLDQLSGSVTNFTGAQPGKVNDKLLDSLNAPKGRKGADPDALAREAEQRTKQFNDRMASFDDQQLHDRASMTGDIQEQAAIENEIGQRALQRQLDDIESQRKENLTRKGVDAALENQRAAALRSAAIKTEQADSDAREQDVSERSSQQQEKIYEDRLSVDRDGIEARQSLARTDKDRLTLALQSLAKEQEAERSSLQNEIDNAKPGTDTTALQYRLNNLPQTYADRAQAAQQQNAGPWGDYVNSLPRTADEIGEAFQGAAVDGVKSLNDQLAQTAIKLTGLHGLAAQLLSDFIQIAIKSAEAQAFGGGQTAAPGGGAGGLIKGLLGGIGKIFGGGGGAALGGSAFTSAGDFIGSTAPSAISGFAIDPAMLMLPGLAGGGTFQVNGRGGTDTNIVSINGTPRLRLNTGETVGVVPKNVGSSAAPNVYVTQPIHADFSGARTDEQTMREFQAYADASRRQATTDAVRISGGQAPGIVQKTQTLKG